MGLLGTARVAHLAGQGEAERAELFGEGSRWRQQDLELVRQHFFPHAEERERRASASGARIATARHSEANPRKWRGNIENAVSRRRSMRGGTIPFANPNRLIGCSGEEGGRATEGRGGGGLGRKGEEASGNEGQCGRPFDGWRHGGHRDRGVGGGERCGRRILAAASGCVVHRGRWRRRNRGAFGAVMIAVATAACRQVFFSRRGNGAQQRREQHEAE